MQPLCFIQARLIDQRLKLPTQDLDFDLRGVHADALRKDASILVNIPYY
jgi:hypothetical protein